MSQTPQVAIAESELRAGARVLRGLMFSDHPIVRRTVGEALGELRVEDALRCVNRMEAALLESGTMGTSSQVAPGGDKCKGADDGGKEPSPPVVPLQVADVRD